MENEEIWKPLIIDDIEFGYYVSNYGRIYGTYREKLIKPEETHNGYLRITIHWPDHKKKKKFFVHRLVGWLFVDGYKPGLQIHHKDHDHKNNYYKNLAWVSEEENNQEAIDANSHPSLSQHPGAKYTNNQIKEVCKMLEKHFSYQEICRKTGVNFHTIHDIKRRKTWLNISKDYFWSDDPNTKYSQYYKSIIKLFHDGLKTKEIMKELNIPYSNKNFRAMVSRLRYKYNKLFI